MRTEVIHTFQSRKEGWKEGRKEGRKEGKKERKKVFLLKVPVRCKRRNYLYFVLRLDP